MSIWGEIMKLAPQDSFISQSHFNNCRIRRLYKRVPKRRPYEDKTPNRLEVCLQAVHDGMQHRLVGRMFEVCQKPLQDKIKNKHPSFLSSDREAPLNLAKWPWVTIISCYLHCKGRKVKHFENSKQGRDRVAKFLSRPNDSTTIFVVNINRRKDT